MRIRGRIPIAATLLFCGMLASLALGEALLRLVGKPRKIGYATGWAMDDMAARYVPRPGRYKGVFGTSARFDRLGLRGPEIDRADVLFLGDSCTFGVGVPEERAFPGLIAGRGLATANAGVPGYNTTSGLARLRTGSLLALKPRAVVMYFGWNDHWEAAATERAFTGLRSLARHSRIASLLLQFQQSLYQADTFFGRIRLVPQVPLGDFTENLEAMVALSRSAGARVIVVTAASDPARMVETWPYLRDYRRYHGRYVDAVRAVAAKTGADLVDFSLDVERMSPAERDRIFMDSIHLSAEGHRRLAEKLLAVLR